MYIMNELPTDYHHNMTLIYMEELLDQEGLDLVETREDPMERRRKLVKLTPKGKKLFNQFI